MHRDALIAPTPREDVWELDLSEWFRPRFPSADLIDAAAGMFDGLPAWDGREGPRWRVSISPGVVAVGMKDPARHERRHEHDVSTHRVPIVVLASWLREHGEFPEQRPPTREVTSWSRKSRANMIRALGELDYAPMFEASGLPAMVTLTYPGEWLSVAPDGKSAKGHLQTFWKRWQRAWGQPFSGPWKLEFQRRGAPHYHLMVVPPQGRAGAHRVGRQRAAVGDGMTFRHWLSATWADIVGHPDPVQRMRHETAGTGVDYEKALRTYDPRRLANYFSKHGTYAAKEYQHCVPEQWQEPGRGPGRFWGYRGLHRAVRVVEVTPDAGIQLGRTLRRWAKTQGTREVRVARVDTETGRVRWRTVHRPLRRLKNCRGWVSVNDGAAFAATLSKLVC